MSTSGPDASCAISAGALRSARRLLKKSGREAQKSFLVEGVQAVREALRVPGLVCLLVVDDPAKHAEIIGSSTCKIVSATTKDIASLSDVVTSQGVIAVCRMVDSSFKDISANPKLVIICSQIRDPGNAGTVIRCADAFGADAVVFTRGSVDVYNPKTVRASVGSIFHLPIVVGVDLDEALRWAHSEGLQRLAADARGVGLDAVRAAGGLARPTAWVMGNEAWGFTAHELEGIDHVVSIPMWGKAESLNVATAAAICLFTTAEAQR